MATIRSSVAGAGRSAGWLVALNEPDESIVVTEAIRASGMDAVVAEPAALPGVCRDRVGIVLEAPRRTGASGAALLQFLRAEQPELEVLVVHDPSDLAMSWAALRSAATPWPRQSSGGSFAHDTVGLTGLVERMHELACGPTMTAESVRGAIVTAVADAVTGRMDAAVLELCRVQRAGGSAVAVEALTARSGDLLLQLEARARYPIPVRFVVDRLEVDVDGALELSIDFLCAVATGGVGDRLRAATGLEGAATADQLAAAFQATTALVRFAAARWWSDPMAVLERVCDHVALEASSPSDPPMVRTVRSGSPHGRR